MIDVQYCTVCGRMLRVNRTRKAIIIYRCEFCLADMEELILLRRLRAELCKMKKDYTDLEERFDLLIDADIKLLELSKK